MRRILALLLAAALLVVAQDWRTVQNLPGVDWKSLKPAQQQTVLKVLREFDCSCGCLMKVAQCRVEDPPCAQSRALAAMAVEAARSGKGEPGIRQALEGSNLVSRAGQRNRVLLDPVDIPIQNAPAKGASNARITLVEFSDFQCPFCIRAIPQLNAVLKAYPNEVRLVYKQFPLDNHSQARLAAQAAVAADAQGKFWPLHDRLYSNSRQINRANIHAWAKELGLDMAKFTAALDSAATKALVDRDIADGDRVGVEGTPTVFVNGKKYQGSLDAAVFLPVIASELKGR